MSDPTDDILGRWSHAGMSGSWGDEPKPQGDPQEAHNNLWASLMDYAKGLPGRAMVGFADEGHRLRDQSVKETARNTYGVGHGVDAYDAAKEGRYGAALGNAALGALDLAAPITSPAVATGDAALRAWKLAEQARPGQVAEALAKLTTKRMKTAGPAADRRAAAAERSIPWPEIPAGAQGSPQRAQSMLDVIDRTWPGNVGASVGVAGGATGIPGTVLDDAKGMVDPTHDMQRDMSTESMDHGAPFRPEASPEVAHYQKQLDEARRARNINMGYAGAETAGGIGATYGAMKSVPWAMRNAGGLGLAGLGAELATHHPMLGLPIMALGAAPFAIPAGLGYASWQAANAIPHNIEHAQHAHAKAKLLQKILDNYREQPNPMSLNPPSDDY